MTHFVANANRLLESLPVLPVALSSLCLLGQNGVMEVVVD